jgi:glycosyltransferase involved in cell wall biosynthesis
MIVDVIIPAFNEEGTIGRVVGDIDRNLVRNVIVVNNGSTDATVQVAETAGALVLNETFMGYGAACLKGIKYVNDVPEKAQVIVFMDGDYSDHPEQLIELIEPIRANEVDMVIGSRALGIRESGSMTPQQVFGNWLATFLIRIIYKVKFTDLGPFRAVSLDALNKMDMKDRTYGWTVEMQVKAIRQGLRFKEIPVNYRKRGAGKSKVAGTVKGTIFAGYKIIATILKYS